jgi:hypothetical protein
MKGEELNTNPVTPPDQLVKQEHWDADDYDWNTRQAMLKPGKKHLQLILTFAAAMFVAVFMMWLVKIFQDKIFALSVII